MTTEYLLCSAEGRILGEARMNLVDITRTAELNGAAYFVEGSGNPLTDYVVEGKVTPRPVLPIQLSGLNLEGIPAGAVVIIDGESYSADGSAITLEFSYSGTYTVKVKLWPYQDWETSLEN